MYDDNLESEDIQELEPSVTMDPEMEIEVSDVDPVLVDLVVQAVLEELESQSPTPLPVEITNYESVSLDTDLNNLNFPSVAICICLLLFFVVLGWRLGNE